MPESALHNRLLLSQEVYCLLPALRLSPMPSLTWLIEDIDELMIESEIRGMFLSGWLRR